MTRTCTKRKHETEAIAHRAMRQAGFRYRIYRCPDCHFLHVTANEKRENRPSIEKHNERRRDGGRL